MRIRNMMHIYALIIFIITKLICSFARNHFKFHSF